MNSLLSTSDFEEQRRLIEERSAAVQNSEYYTVEEKERDRGKLWKLLQQLDTLQKKPNEIEAQADANFPHADQAKDNSVLPDEPECAHNSSLSMEEMTEGGPIIEARETGNRRRRAPKDSKVVKRKRLDEEHAEDVDVVKNMN